MPPRVQPGQRWHFAAGGISFTITEVSGEGPSATAMVVLDDGEKRGPWLVSQISRGEYLDPLEPEPARIERRQIADAIRHQLDVLRREVAQLERSGPAGLEPLKRWRRELQALLEHHFSM